MVAQVQTRVYEGTDPGSSTTVEWGTLTQVTWKRGLAHRTTHTSVRASKDGRTLALTEVLTDAAHVTRNKAWPGHCHGQT